MRRLLRGRTAFALAVVITNAELEAACTLLANAAEGDADLWLAYPKGTSKKYTCEFSRDTGWSTLGRAGFAPVRQGPSTTTGRRCAFAVPNISRR